MEAIEEVFEVGLVREFSVRFRSLFLPMFVVGFSEIEKPIPEIQSAAGVLSTLKSLLP